MAFTSFSSDLIPVMIFSCSFSNSAWVNSGFFTASAINSTNRSKYFDNPLAEAELAPKLMEAPIKSTSSLKVSLDRLVVPLPIMELNKLDTPALSPSNTGGLSKIN